MPAVVLSGFDHRFTTIPDDLGTARSAVLFA
jgi:hypothetical protein